MATIKFGDMNTSDQQLALLSVVIWDVIRKWDLEGRDLPRYKELYDLPQGDTPYYLKQLLGLDTERFVSMDEFDGHEHVLEALAGPYGWTVYQMLLVKRGWK